MSTKTVLSDAEKGEWYDRTIRLYIAVASGLSIGLAGVMALGVV